MVRFVAFFLAFLAPAVSAVAQTAPPPLEAYGKLPVVASAELSPDGTKVAAIINIEDSATLQVLTLDGEMIRGGYLEESKARGVSFFDNNHVILRVSETTSTIGFRGDYEYSVSFAQNIETGEYTQLPLRVDELFPAQSGLGRLIGDSDRDGWVLMPAYIGPRYADPEYELLRVKLETGRGVRYARGTPDTIDWFTGKGGKVLARERYSNKRNMYRIQVAKGRGSWTTIYEQESDIPPLYMAGVMPDESGLSLSKPIRSRAVSIHS